MLISIDGYFEGPNRELDWHNVDAEFNEYAINNLNNLDLLLFGRVTYELMAGYWPTDLALGDDPIVAEKMNNIKKIVFSKTLGNAEWNNTELFSDNVVEKVKYLKQLPGKDIAIFGSSDLAVTLIPSGLIDEFHIFVSPIVLGRGKTIFTGLNEKLNLELKNVRHFDTGNVLLKYVNSKK